MKKEYAYSPCKNARKYDEKCIKCRIDKSKRRPDKQRGPNACGRGCPGFELRLWSRLFGIKRGY